MVTLFVLGVLCALLVDEATGVTPGGYVVPGYLALTAASPRQLVATFAAVIVVAGVIRLLERAVLLYGRRRLAYAVLTSVLLKAILLLAVPRLALLPAAALLVGYVVPGLIADRCLRQGLARTLAATALATSLAYLAGRVVLG